MSYQIVVLGTSKQLDGAFAVSGVFWLSAPTNKIVPQPGFSSQVPNIDSATLLALQVGTLIEKPFTTGLFVSDTELTTVQSTLQNQFADAQVALDSAPLTGLVGSIFDGNEWQQPTPFNPSVPSKGMLVDVQTDDGRYLPVSGKSTLEGIPIFSLDAPQEQDKKFVFVNSPGREGTYTWITSNGDNLNPAPPSSGRGEGYQGFLEFTEPGTKEVELQFCEPIELHAGHVSWREVSNWGFEDNWSLSVRLPATTTTPSPLGTGNCNLIDTGMGFNIIVPANGDGYYDVDLNTADPIPDGRNIKINQGTGYWDVDQYWSEEITPTPDGYGCFNLYDIPLEMFFIKKLDCGSPQGIWEFGGYKAEWISKKWKVCFQATRVTSGAGKIGGYFYLFRPGAT